MTPGERVAFDVYSVRANNLIVPLFSLVGDGPTQLGIGVSVNLSMPIGTSTPAFTDSNGRVTYQGNLIPNSTPLGISVWVQALEIPFAPGEAEFVSNLVELQIGQQ